VADAPVRFPLSPGREFPGTETPSAVLFACTHNALRSPMAAALMRHFHGHHIWVQSVGVHRGEPDPFAIAVMDEIGIDISMHKPQRFDDLEDSFFDLVVSLSPEAQHHAVEMTRNMACDVLFWPTFDPSTIDGNRETMLDAYRSVRDQLSQRILRRFPLNAARD
jgi:protein-tyrosine-phosphatase